MNFPSVEFDQALARICEGGSDEAELTALRDLLLSNEEAMDRYLAYVDLHASLVSDPGIGLALDAEPPPPLSAVESPGRPAHRFPILTAAAAVFILGSVITAWVYLSGPPVNPETATAPEPQIHFHSDIEPILRENCLECHGDKEKGGLRLDSLASILAGGESGEPAIIMGQAENSPLIQRVSSHDPDEKMPAKGDPLTGEQITLLANWIDEYPRNQNR